jgi:hypothetical protein
MNEFQDPKYLRHFFSVCSKGRVVEICTDLGISKSKYYRIIDWLEQRLEFAKLTEDEKVMRQRGIPSKTEKRIKDISLTHPGWGCSLITKEISRSEAITPPTVQKQLTHLGRATRKQRIDHLIATLISGDLTEPSEEQYQIAVRENPSVADLPRLGDQRNLSVGSSLISVDNILGKHWKFLLLVDLNSLFAFGRFVRMTQKFEHTRALQAAIQEGCETLMDMADRRSCTVYHFFKSEFLNIDRRSSRDGPIRNIRFCYKRSLDGGTSILNKRVRSDILRSQCSLPAVGDARELGENLLRWLITHNTSPTIHAFPGNKKSPVDSLCIKKSSAQRFLGSLLSKPLDFLELHEDYRLGLKFFR